MLDLSLVDLIFALLIGMMLCVMVCLISMLSNASKEQKTRNEILKLCPFDDAYLLSDITLHLNANNTTQIDHVLITRQGIFVIEEKNYSGILEGRECEKQWRKSVRGESISLGNPFRQNFSHIHGILRAVKQNDLECINVVLINGKCQYRGPNQPEWLCFGILEMVNKMRQQDPVYRYTTAELSEIKNAVTNASMPKSLLTDLGHIISLSRKHQKKIPIVIMVSYYALLTPKNIWNGLMTILAMGNKAGLRKATKKK